MIPGNNYACVQRNRITEKHPCKLFVPSLIIIFIKNHGTYYMHNNKQDINVQLMKAQIFTLEQSNACIKLKPSYYSRKH